MNLSVVDWAIIIVSIIALRFVSLSTRSFMKGVADFLSANRAAGRYLLTISSQMGGVGVVTFVGFSEVVCSAGLTPRWWDLLTGPIMAVIIPLTGWVFYRFRETRALTMAQFLEARYSRRFRIFAGILCWTSGVLNFGIFPAAAAHFFMYYCGLPVYFHIPGIPFHISTFAAVMLVDMVLALSFVIMGGQISVMVTECVQGIFCAAAFVVVSASILIQLSWSQIVQALSSTQAGASMINPFHTSQIKDYNAWFFLIGVFGAFYTYNSWQGSQGFYSSARTPHEQKMGNIIGSWRMIPQGLLMLLLPLAGLAIMRLPEYSATAALINDAVKHIPNGVIREQARVPIALAHFLPVGIKGLLATVMLFISFTCHDTYMHSWGAIFVQDVVMPIRNKPLDPQRHIRWLRWSIVFVAVFGFLFSLLVPPTQKIYMFFNITGTLWLAGSGAVIIGGLYWKKGTTAAAFVALCVGLVFGTGGLIAPYVYKALYHKDLFINGAYLLFAGMITASFLYVLISLLTCDKQFDLEHMLYRGKYAVQGDHQPVGERPRSSWTRVWGITEEFSRGDKLLAYILVGWNILWLVFFGVFTAINLLHGMSDATWLKYWHFSILLNLSISIPVVIWFAIGGILDMKALFRTLSTAARNAADDGLVRVGSEAAPAFVDKEEHETSATP